MTTVSPADEPMAPPQYINGLVVVACVRVAGRDENQWFVIVRDRRGTHVVWYVGWDGAYKTFAGDFDLTYPQALQRLAERSGLFEYCSQCSAGHAGSDGLCKRHGKRVLA